MTVIEERYDLALGRIGQIAGQQETEKRFRPFFAESAAYLTVMAEEYEWIASGALKKADLFTLTRHNEACFIDLVGKNYETSYANPAFAVQKLGRDYGRILCALSAELHSLPAFVYEQDLEAVTIRMELFLEIYGAFCSAYTEEGGVPAWETVRKIYYWFASDYMEPIMERAVADSVDWERNFALRILEESDLSDIRYLFYYGEYITDDQWKTAEHLNALPEETIRRIADAYTGGFQRGFELAKKPLDRKCSVNLRYPLGFERIVREAVKNFRKMGLQPVIYRAPSSFLAGRSVLKNGFFGGWVNRQFEYDHEHDQALYLDRQFVNHKLECRKNAWEKYRRKATSQAGPAVIESFGEVPFEPERKKERLTLSKRQEKLSVEYQNRADMQANDYMDPWERSFTIIAFPIPQIGEEYPAIFDAIAAVNTLDTRRYEIMQQTLIDALDQAAWVEVKGKNQNRTDLKIMLHKLKDPQQETNFENCLADVNIPVGEVFTSPQLAGTQGLLHVPCVYLNGIRYLDLELTFRDGMIADYGCANFERPQEGKKLLEDKVLHHHKTLPLGEFAIGTNTAAFMTAKRYGILDRLPILIAEKMGPHFAVGDTCYSHEEERMTYNPNGKALVARENEVSALRCRDFEKAYFNCHTDITIPYEELGEVTAVKADGTRIDLIRDGRFVLEGTQELNLPFYSG